MFEECNSKDTIEKMVEDVHGLLQKPGVREPLLPDLERENPGIQGQHYCRPDSTATLLLVVPVVTGFVPHRPTKNHLLKQW